METKYKLFNPEVVKVDYNKDEDKDIARVLIKVKYWSVWLKVNLVNGSIEWEQKCYGLFFNKKGKLRKDRMAKTLQEASLIYESCEDVALSHLCREGLMKSWLTKVKYGFEKV